MPTILIGNPEVSPDWQVIEYKVEAEMYEYWHEENTYYPEKWMDRCIDYALWEAFTIAHTDDYPVNSNEDLDKIDYVLCGRVQDSILEGGQWAVRMKTGAYRLLDYDEEIDYHPDMENPYDLLTIERCKIARGQLEIALHNAHLRNSKEVDVMARITQLLDKLDQPERDANAQALAVLDEVLTIVNSARQKLSSENS